MPRLTSRGLLTALLAVALASQVSQAQSPNEWPEFRGSGDNRGMVSTNVPAVEWTVPFGAPVRALSYAHGVIVAGADHSGLLKVIDFATGRVRWAATLPSSIHNDPAVAAGVVVATFGDWPQPDFAGGVRAFDLETGTLKWSVDAKASIMPSPAIVGRIVIVTAFDDCVRGYDLFNGKKRWERCISVAPGMSSPRIWNDLVVYGTGEGRLVAIEAATGNVRWIQRYSQVIHVGDASAAVDSASVYIVGTTLHGSRLHYRDTSFAIATRDVASALVYRRFSDRDSYFARQYLLRARMSDGRLEWAFPMMSGPSVDRNQSGTPALAGDIVVASSPVASRLYAVSRSTGRAVWDIALPARHRGAPTIIGNTILIGTEDGSLSAYALATGNLVGRCSWPGAFTPASPLVVGQTLIYGSTDGILRAVPMDRLTRRLGAERSCV